VQKLIVVSTRAVRGSCSVTETNIVLSTIISIALGIISVTLLWIAHSLHRMAIWTEGVRGNIEEHE